MPGEKREKIGFITVAAILLFDQLTKFLATKNLPFNKSVPLIKGVFHFTLVHNRGAAFGTLKNQNNLFILTALFIIILICLNLDGRKHKKTYIFCLSLILAGALGNLIDRLFLGYVIDFLDFRIWPVFNVADSAITVGAIILGWNTIFSKNGKVATSGSEDAIS